MPKITQMRTLVLAVDLGSIIAAARYLGISKAAASKQIIELEKEIKLELLHRTTRTLGLTDVGASYYDAFKKVLSAVDDVDGLMQQSHEIPMGTLRVVTHRYFGEKYILRHLKEFSERYPNIKFDIEFAERFPDLDSENIDILFGVGIEGPEHLVRKRIAIGQKIMCASPSYLETHGVPQKPEDLIHHQLIIHALHKAEYGSFIRVNDTRAMFNLAKQGLGIIKLNNYHLEEAIKSGLLVEILADYREPLVNINVFYKQQKYVQPKIRRFLDFLYEKLGDEHMAVKC